MPDQPTPVTLSDEALVEVEARLAVIDRERLTMAAAIFLDTSVPVLCATVRALRAERDTLALWKAKMLVRCEEVDTVLDNSAADYTRLSAENAALRDQLDQAQEALTIISEKKYDVWAFSECVSVAKNTLAELEK